MHLYLLTRGTLRAVREWKEGLSNQYLPMEIKNKEGKIEKCMAQLQIRPVELYEVVFPEEHEATVMGMIKPQTDVSVYGGKWAKVALWFSKRLGLKPPIKDYKNLLLPPNCGVAALALGTKKDVVNWKKKEGANSLLDKGNKPRENL